MRGTPPSVMDDTEVVEESQDVSESSFVSDDNNDDDNDSEVSDSPTPMPDLTSLTGQIRDDLMDVHNTAMRDLADKFQSHAVETGQRLAESYADRSRDYLSRSQTGTAFFRTGHAIANAYLEEQIARGETP